jgi:hypothetical protein
MKKAILLLIYFVGLSNYIYSQWQQLSPNLNVNTFVLKDSNIYVGTTFDGFYLSTDNGISWNSANNGFIQTQTNIMALLLIDSNIFVGTYNYNIDNGVFLSTNNGENWNAMYNGLPSNNWVFSLATDGTNIFAGAGGSYSTGKVFFSNDNGVSWTNINNGLSDPSNVCSLFINGTNIFAGTYSNGIFISSNLGASWTAVNTGLTNTSVWSFVVKDSNIYAGTKGGLFKSNNFGLNWTNVSNGMPPNTFIRSLATIGTNIFAGTYSDGVFVSIDNAANWNAVNSGLTNFEVSSLAVDSFNVYAGTWGAGIWKRSLSDMVCSAQFTIVPDTTIQHHYFIVNNAGGIPPLSYYWSWGDGTHDSIAYPSHIYDTSGFYTICLTITDAAGCSSTYCDSSYLQKNTDNIVYIDVVSQIPSAINENIISDNLKIFPNPTTNNLMIEGERIAKIEILNIEGQIIKRLKTKENKTDIDVSNFASGVYIIRVQTDKCIVTRKFVKE